MRYLPELPAEYAGGLEKEGAAALPRPIGESQVPTAPSTVPGKSAPSAQLELFEPPPELAARAATAETSIGRVPAGKTVSASESGNRTLSGWTDKKGFSQSTNEVMAATDEMGFPLKPHRLFDRGVPGRYQASHAELQNLVQRPGEVLAVSQNMCGSVPSFFLPVCAKPGVRVVHQGSPRDLGVSHERLGLTVPGEEAIVTFVVP
jgi:hypothetical protein